ALPQAARSRPLASANPAPQRAPANLQRVIEATPWYRAPMDCSVLALANTEQITFDDLLPRAYVPGEEILVAPRLQVEAVTHPEGVLVVEQEGHRGLLVDHGHRPLQQR